MNLPGGFIGFLWILFVVRSRKLTERDSNLIETSEFWLSLKLIFLKSLILLVVWLALTWVNPSFDVYINISMTGREGHDGHGLLGRQTKI